MKKETKDAVIDIITVVILVVIMLTTTLIYGLKYKALERDYYDQERAYYNQRLYYEVEFTEMETWGEYMEEKLEEYDALKADYAALKADYEALLKEGKKESKYDIKQIIIDYDDLIEYLNYYQSYVERNPDVTFEQFVQFYDPELYARLIEYEDL